MGKKTGVPVRLHDSRRPFKEDEERIRKCGHVGCAGAVEQRGNGSGGLHHVCCLTRPRDGEVCTCIRCELHGDSVQVSDEPDTFLANARLSLDTRAGAVQVTTGAWFNLRDDATGKAGQGPDQVLCRHGNRSALTPHIGSSALTQDGSAQNARVEVERWTAGVPPLRMLQPPPGVPARS